jgi:hypothetical protein
VSMNLTKLLDWVNGLSKGCDCSEDLPQNPLANGPCVVSLQMKFLSPRGLIMELICNTQVKLQ